MPLNQIIRDGYRQTLFPWASALALVAVVGSGCVSLPAKPAPTTTAGSTEPDGDSSEPPVPPATDRAAPDPAAPESLAAIEEFLMRTREYRSSPRSADEALPDPPERPRAERAIQPAAGKTRNAPAEPPKPPLASANTQMDVGADEFAEPSLALPALERVAIRTPSADSREPEAPPPANVANVPMQAPSTDHRPSLEQLIARLQAEAAQNSDFDSEWRLRLVQLAADRHGDAVELSASLPEESRLMLSGLIEAAIAVRRLSRSPMLDARDFLDRLEALRQAIAERTDPRIETLAFCSRVLTYGVYDEMAPDAFVAGRATPTILYSALSNLRARKADDGMYETRLTSRVEILTDDGESMWMREEPEILDRCRDRRRDFFLAQRITIPATLPAGDYTLKLHVTDRVAGKATESIKKFSILSPVSVAKADQE